jgi:hypothetical protein
MFPWTTQHFDTMLSTVQKMPGGDSVVTGVDGGRSALVWESVMSYGATQPWLAAKTSDGTGFIVPPDQRDWMKMAFESSVSYTGSSVIQYAENAARTLLSHWGVDATGMFHGHSFMLNIGTDEQVPHWDTSWGA